MEPRTREISNIFKYTFYFSNNNKIRAGDPIGNGGSL